MKNFVLCSLLLFFNLIGMSSLAQAVDHPILGKWLMHQVIQNESDVTDQHNPKQDRWVSFHEDGTFVSDGSPFGRNTGTYQMESNHILFLDSNAGSDDDSQWSVSFVENLMIWKGIGSEFAMGFQLIHKKEH